jgi:citrate lyase beta subunit
MAAPIGPVETNLADDDLLAESTTSLVRQGFRARTALHPNQLPTINAVFTPSREEVAAARELLADFTTGAGVNRHGRFVDAACSAPPARPSTARPWRGASPDRFTRIAHFALNASDRVIAWNG